MDAVIAAGGRGTRLAGLYKKTPKALVKIGGKPLIEHQIELLRKNGIKNIRLLLGYLGDEIKNHVKDGKKFGVNIYCHQEDVPLGRTGALKAIESKIKDDFLFLSGDVMMDFDVQRFIKWHNQKKDSIASLVVHPSDHPLDSDLVQADESGKITSLWLKPHEKGINFQNLGIASVFIFSPEVLKYIPPGEKSDFEKDVLPSVLKSDKKIYAYKTPEYIKDMGTPERLAAVRKDYVSGKVSKLNLRNKRGAVFLDRDGVINEESDNLSDAGNFKLFDFSAKAVKKINDSGFLAIVATNQPIIAKGFISRDGLSEIHKKMETELGMGGAKLDAIYYCPHHPERGFPGEVEELKIECDCRKPGIGMIKQAARDFNLDLKSSFFIGDSTRDAKTAENAKIKFIGVKTGYGCRDGKYRTKQDFPMCENLLEAAEMIKRKNVVIN